LKFWTHWVGLPWALGADPRDGKAACCFRTAQAIREGLGMPWPARRMQNWYSAARRGDWDRLLQDWEEITAPTETPAAGTLIRFDNPSDGSFGVGVLPDERSFITVRHYGRLIAGPISACRKLKLYELQ
jgi:hypothetical protein